jgi:hypothetical protein
MKMLAPGLAAAASLLLLATLAPAHAQATRTWVSGVGDDVNPCSRTAPCKTFAGAISKTAAGGEISVLDPGGFGGVTINKSLSIVSEDSGEGGVLVGGSNGITIDGAGIVVTLRGLIITTGAGPSAGTVGVNIVNAAQVHVQRCTITNFTTGPAAGIQFISAGSAPSQLFVSDSVLSNNGNTASNGGVVIAPTGSGAVTVVLARVQLEGNSSGLVATGTAGPITISASDSSFSGSPNAGVYATAAQGLETQVLLSRSAVVGNGTGIAVEGTQASVLASETTIAGNATGLIVANDGNIGTFLNNPMYANPTPGSFTFKAFLE